MSREAIASRTGQSIGFISQVDRSWSSPELRLLALLADTLRIRISPSVICVA